MCNPETQLKRSLLVAFPCKPMTATSLAPKQGEALTLAHLLALEDQTLSFQHRTPLALDIDPTVTHNQLIATISTQECQ